MTFSVIRNKVTLGLLSINKTQTQHGLRLASPRNSIRFQTSRLFHPEQAAWFGVPSLPGVRVPDLQDRDPAAEGRRPFSAYGSRSFLCTVGEKNEQFV